LGDFHVFKKLLELPQAAEGFCCDGFRWGLKGWAFAWLVLALSMAIFAPREAVAQMTKKAMPYEECLASKAEMQAQLAVQPEHVFDIVSTAGVTITRLCTANGSVLIGCSRPGEAMVISVRPSQSALGCLWKSLVKTPT
jgi:hypothetical protein